MTLSVSSNGVPSQLATIQPLAIASCIEENGKFSPLVAREEVSVAVYEAYRHTDANQNRRKTKRRDMPCGVV